MLRYAEYRRYDRENPVVPQYDPGDFDIYEASFLHDGRFESENLGAYVTDLAIKRYITIETIDQESYIIQSNLDLQDVYEVDATTQHVISLLERASPLGKGGDDTFWVRELKKTLGSLFSLSIKKKEQEYLKEFLYKQTLSAAKEASSRLQEKGLVTHSFASGLFVDSSFRKEEKKFLGGMVLLAIIGASVSSPWVALVFFGMIITILIIEIALPYLPQLTQQGFEARRYIQGLYKYIDHAEEHRIEALNRDALTPELYEKLLPYAMIFGLEKKWSEAFGEFGVVPEWYDERIGEGALSSGIKVQMKGFFFMAMLGMLSTLRRR